MSFVRFCKEKAEGLFFCKQGGVPPGHLFPRRLGLGPARTFLKSEKFSEILKKISIIYLQLLSDEDPPPSFSQRDPYKILKMKSWGGEQTNFPENRCI